MSPKVGPTVRPAPGSKLSAYLRVKEAAEFLGISPWTLRKWDSNGKLNAFRHPKNRYRLYRSEELQRLLEHDLLRSRLYDRFPPPFEWSQLRASDHLVQFYEGDSFLTGSVSRLIREAIDAGEGAVLIATRPHREEIQRRLRARHVNLAAARADGQLLALDAGETLASFMAGQLPDARRFRDLLGGVISRVGESRKRVRAFGEMVALLWAGGQSRAVIRLEQLWNELQRSHGFVLQCGYPLRAFGRAQDGRAFDRICACHTRALPTESYSRLRTAEGRLRAVARLQQRAIAVSEAGVAEQKRKTQPHPPPVRP